MLLLEDVGTWEGNEVVGFDCNELVEFTLGIAPLFPLLYRPFTLVIA
jgi:hypothetical protein